MFNGCSKRNRKLLSIMWHGDYKVKATDKGRLLDSLQSESEKSEGKVHE